MKTTFNLQKGLSKALLGKYIARQRKIPKAFWGKRIRHFLICPNEGVDCIWVALRLEDGAFLQISEYDDIKLDTKPAKK